MKRKFWIGASFSALVVAAMAPWTASQANGVSVRVNTPEFGIRIGAPFHRPPIYQPAPVYYEPAPVYYPAPVHYPRYRYAPPPVVYAAPPRYYAPPHFAGYGGYGHYRHRWQHRHGHHDRHWQQRHHRDDDR